MVGFYICLTLMLLSLVTPPIIIKFNSRFNLGEIGFMMISSIFLFWVSFIGLIISACVVNMIKNFNNNRNKT